ncbi:MAG: hypothetical protein IAG13_32060 [Deltaproteobacteria bacterium]|nr:hypothetical protein [Nannocystaceae bacterium]
MAVRRHLRPVLVVQHALVLAISGQLAACDRATYMEGRVDWRSVDDVYGVQYVAPPWEVDSDDGVELRLRVQPELFGSMIQGSPPTHVFVLGPADPDVPLETLLPTDLTFDVDEVTEALESSGGLVEDLPLPLDGVDLGQPRSVALAELNYLLDEHDADLRHELAQTEPGGPWRFDVVIAPGMLVRGLYYDDGERTVRGLFASLFDIGDGDVEQMGATIQVGQGGAP